MNKLQELREIYKKESEQDEEDESLYKITSISNDDVSKRSINKSMTEVLLPFKVNYPKKLPRKSNTDSTLIVNYTEFASQEIDVQNSLKSESDKTYTKLLEESVINETILKLSDDMNNTKQGKSKHHSRTSTQEELEAMNELLNNSNTDIIEDVKDKQPLKKVKSKSKHHSRTSTQEE
jgi:hypothetical protein